MKIETIVKFLQRVVEPSVRLSEYDRAEADCKSFLAKRSVDAVVDQPHRIPLQCNDHRKFSLGLLLKHSGKLDEAMHLFQQTLSCRSLFLESHNQLADCLIQKNEHRDALTRLERALALKGHPDDAYRSLRHTLAQLYRHMQAPKEPSAANRKGVRAMAPAAVAAAVTELP